MKILIISNCSLRADQGSGYIILGFAEGLRARGHQVKAFGPEQFILFPAIKKAKRLRLFFGYTIKAILEAWKARHSLDILEFWGGPGWLAILLLGKFRIGRYKVISRSNGLEPFYRQQTRNTKISLSLLDVLLSGLQDLTDEIGFRNADMLTLVSKSDEKYAINKLYQSPDRLLVIENALPNDWLDEQPQELDNTTFRIGFVGSWNENKGTNQLIKIVNLLTAAGGKVEWIIVGVGENGKKVLIEQTGLRQTEVHEHISRHNLKKLYRQMTVLLCLSSYESFGMACSEAMANGSILLSTDVGFASGLTNQQDYLQIERTNPEAIAKQIDEIRRDPCAYSRIRIAGQKRVQQLRWPLNVETLEMAYKNMLAKP
jgi:glycosyltransferase involved in cell wall biosynthesis